MKTRELKKIKNAIRERDPDDGAVQLAKMLLDTIKEQR